MAYFNLSALLPFLILMSACAPPTADNASSERLTEADERSALAEASGLYQPGVATELLDCRPSPDMTVHCGYQNPEDLVALPGGKFLIVSEMGEFLTDAPGRLSMLNLISGKREILKITWSSTESKRGDVACPAPDIEAFSPHGIDLVTLDDGPLQLLVVNHGGRESIEFFEPKQSEGVWSLDWQGCALPPDDPFINDVAGLHDGGFLITHMWDKTTAFDEVARKLLAGESTGWVYEWQPDEGFTKVPGTDDLMPNGIAVSHDNTKLFVNIYFGGKTIKIDRATAMREGEFSVQQPDNITVDAEGNLWVASHKNDPIGQSCALVTAGPCLLPYEIIKADPSTMTSEVVHAQDGAPMGFATVALKVGDRLYLGSAHGDRVVSSAAR